MSERKAKAPNWSHQKQVIWGSIGTLLLLGTTACGATKGGSGGALSADEARATVDSVTALVSSWRLAVNSLDTVRVAEFYSQDTTFRWVEDGRLRYRSGAELVKAWRGTVPSLRSVDLILDETEVTPLASGVAVVTTLFTQKVVDTAGRQGGFTGATSLVAVRTPSGWRFLTGHTSAVGGPGTAQP